MSAPRCIDVFFYGLFMDEELLRSKRIDLQRYELASVENFKLVIGPRATLVPCPGRKIFGVLASMTHKDIDALYSDPSLDSYRPEAVMAITCDGTAVPALCFNLRIAPSPEERNPDYANRLRQLAERLGLPSSYVSTIE